MEKRCFGLGVRTSDRAQGGKAIGKRDAYFKLLGNSQLYGLLGW
jgi:hypothetical protein